MNCSSSVSTMRALHGMAKSLSPMPRNPPNESTAYATRPFSMSIIKCSDLDELFFISIYHEGAPRDGKKLIPHAQESPERKYRVRDAALLDVDHQMFDLSKVLFLTVNDLIAGKSVCRQNTVHPSSLGVSRLWHEFSFDLDAPSKLNNCKG